MTRFGMWFHVTLCAAALAFAWVSAHRVAEKKGGPSSVTLFDVAAGDVTKVVYTWDKGRTETGLVGRDDARRATVTIDRELPPKKPEKKDEKKPENKDDAAAVEVPAALEAPPERETGVVPGGKTVLSAIAALEPLKTKRSLGVVDDDARLSAMGLTKPVRRLEVQAGNRSLVLEIGEASYGAQGRYARVAGSREVHLIDAAIVTGLEGGKDALLEKRLVPWELEKIAGFSLTRGDKTGAFVHVDRDQASVRFVAGKDDPATKKDAAGKVLSTLRNLRGTALASADASAKASAVVVAVVIETESGPWSVDLVERGDSEGFLLRAGGFTYEATPTQARELQDDVDAALAE
jgi:hypothetical protein